MFNHKRSHGPVIIAGALLAAIIVTLAWNHRAVRAVWANWTAVQAEPGPLEPWPGGACHMGTPYAEDSPSQYVDIYVPSGVEKPPLLVLIHGGGFVYNDARSKQARFMVDYFRDRGFACASVNYRLAQEAPFPAAVCDCKAAIRFLRLHAGEYGYEAEHLAVWGESAGGYLAAMCAVTADDQFAEVRCIGQDAGPVSARVDALVDYYGHIDNRGTAEDWRALGIPQAVLAIANGWVTGEVLHGYEDVESYWMRRNISEMSDAEYAVADPHRYIRENDLPGLSAWIVHGDCDITVPWLHSRRLADALEARIGADRVHFRLIPGMGHASDPLYSDAELEPLARWLAARLS